MCYCENYHCAGDCGPEDGFDDVITDALNRAFNTKKKLRTAIPEDFQIVHLDGEYPYTASFLGCNDIAIFKRKADCERFIKSFNRK